MARTAMHADQAEILHQHPDLSFAFDHDLYRIVTHKEGHDWKSEYSISDGTKSDSFPIVWIFGTGRVGQSYLFQNENKKLAESRVTFFQSSKKLEFTPARGLSSPVDVDHAIGREVGTAELIRCFSCHATRVDVAGHFNADGLQPGVGCEACHGPGARHVKQMSLDSLGTGHKELAIYDPSHLSPTESVEFCGACHGSWWDVKLAHVTGPSVVRSAPYRLVTSKCWGREGDERLECVACHNPHKELATGETAYDAACLRCHAKAAKFQPGSVQTAQAHPGAAPSCPVAANKCPACHMPKVYVPEMQNTFTDHRIRVVRNGEAFTD